MHSNLFWGLEFQSKQHRKYLLLLRNNRLGLFTLGTSRAVCTSGVTRVNSHLNKAQFPQPGKLAGNHIDLFKHAYTITVYNSPVLLRMTVWYINSAFRYTLDQIRCVVSSRVETTYSRVDVNNTHPSMIDHIVHDQYFAVSKRNPIYHIFPGLMRPLYRNYNKTTINQNNGTTKCNNS